MKNDEKRVSNEEKLRWAQATLAQVLTALGLNGGHICAFLLSVHEGAERTTKLLEAMEHGVQKNATGALKPTGKRVCGFQVWDFDPRDQQRWEVEMLQHKLFFIWSSLRLAMRQEMDEIHATEKKLREVGQLCIIQMLAGSNQIEGKDMDRFRNMAKYLRGQLEVARVELHLAGEPTYSQPIRHADSFIKMLEERVAIWDKAQRKANKTRTRKTK